MQYTCLGFNQEKLLQLKLDLTDTALLRWYIDFFNTGKMSTIDVINEKTGLVDTFAWIKYDAVVKDLPLLGIHNVRNMARRFDKIVDSGLMFKHVSKTLRGSYACYRLNSDIYNSIISKKTNSSPKKEKIENKNRNASKSILQNVKNIPIDSSKVSASPVCKVSLSPPRTVSESTAKRSLYHKNSSTNLNTYTNNAAAKLKNYSKEEESFLDLKNKFQEISSELVFDSVFYQDAHDYLIKNSLSDNYCRWLFQEVTNKKPRSVRGIFRKLFFEQDILDLYMTKNVSSCKREFIPKPKICPSCRILLVEMNLRCPECKGFFEYESNLKSYIFNSIDIPVIGSNMIEILKKTIHGF